MSHEALDKTAKGRVTYPNVWFVGVTPRRNPELVVAVLWQNGEFSYYPARIGAKVVSAYVEKQRRLAHNLAPVKAGGTGGDGRGMDCSRAQAHDGKPAGMHGGDFPGEERGDCGQVAKRDQTEPQRKPADCSALVSKGSGQ